MAKDKDITHLNAPQKTQLMAHLSHYKNEIDRYVQTRNGKLIKQYWREHKDEMKSLLNALNEAGLKREYALLKKIMYELLYRAVLISRSIRLAKDMMKAVDERTVTTGQIEIFERRGHKIEFEMKRMGFMREAKIHASLLRLHMKEEKHAEATRVIHPPTIRRP